MNKKIFFAFTLNLIVSFIGVVLKVNGYKTVGDVFLLTSVGLFILFLVLVVKKIKA